MTLMKVEHLKKIYGGRTSAQTIALKGVDFTVEEGEFIAIMGESGSGKTTLLNIVATLDTATEGRVVLGEVDLTTLSNKEVAAFRREKMGFIFQQFNLLDRMTNRDNIYLPLVLSGKSTDLMEKRLKDLAPELGIEEILDKFPAQCSGGQQQRVAVARALIHEPSILLADEPTGALDSASSDRLLRLLHGLNQRGQTILMVTHSVKAAAFANRVLFLRDGKLFHEIYRGEESYAPFYSKINDAQSLLTLQGVKDEK